MCSSCPSHPSGWDTCCRSPEERSAIVCSGPKSLALAHSRPEMAPFPDSSLSKVFLSLSLMTLSHPFPARWSRGRCGGGEHPLIPLLQLPSLYPQQVWGPTASLVPQGGNSQLLGLTPFAIISLLIYSYLEPPPGVGAMPFCGSSPPYSRGRSTPMAVPCSQSKCARWVRREIPQMSTGVCPWSHCSPRAVLHPWCQ